MWLSISISRDLNFSIIISNTIFSRQRSQHLSELSCCFRCCSKFPFRLNWLKWLQSWGFSKRWVFMCWFNSDLLMYPLVHSGQLYSCSCWTLTCLLNAAIDPRVLPHSWQMCLLRALLWVFSCCTKCFLKLNTWKV